MNTVAVLLAFACTVGASAGRAAPAKTPSLRAHVDPNEATAQLQGVMAAAQRSLASAERHQEHAVKRARKNLTAFMATEAKTLGSAVATYDQELRQSAADLERIVNASTAALKEEDEHGTITWSDNVGMEARAQLGAQSQLTAGEVRKAARMHERKVHEAVTGAEQSLEDHLTRLSRRIGDVSDVLDTVKTSLEAEAAKFHEANASRNQTSNATANQTGNTSQRMQVLAESLKEARTVHTKRVAEADKKLKNISAGVDKDMEVEVEKLEAALEKKEQDNIRKVRAALVTPPPTAKKAAAKPQANVTAKQSAATQALIALLTGAMKK